MQRLIQPINRALLTASRKNLEYKKKFGFIHHGIDIVSTSGSRIVYAQGEGIVLKSGYDNIFGNIIVIQYLPCLSANGAESDIIARMFHFEQIYVKEGHNVTKDTKIGLYGNTGRYSSGAHLHLEFDYDVLNPYHTPGLLEKSTLLMGVMYGATDSTMPNPTRWFFCKESAPDNQSWITANDRYINVEDKIIEKIK